MNSQKPQSLSENSKEKGQSMDDILAQIRRIVSDEASGGQPSAERAASAKGASPRAANPVFAKQAEPEAPGPADPQADASDNDRPSLRDRLGFGERRLPASEPVADAPSTPAGFDRAPAGIGPATEPAPAEPARAGSGPLFARPTMPMPMAERAAAPPVNKEPDVPAPAPMSDPAGREAQLETFERALKTDEPASPQPLAARPAIEPAAPPVPMPQSSEMAPVAETPVEPVADAGENHASSAADVFGRAPSALDRLKSSMSVASSAADASAAHEDTMAKAATTSAQADVVPPLRSYAEPPVMQPEPAPFPAPFNVEQPAVVAAAPETPVSPISGGLPAPTLEQLVASAIGEQVKVWVDANMERVVRDVVAEDLAERRARNGQG